jgi:hypothetical protein
MTLPVSLILIAVGAILTWGVEDNAENVNLAAIGWILMIVGLIGFLIALFLGPPWGPGVLRRTTYVEGDPGYRRWYGGSRRRVVEEEEAGAPGPPAEGPPPP